LREKVSVEDRRMRGLSKAKAAAGLSAVAAFLFFNPSPDPTPWGHPLPQGEREFAGG
jgi:hypothetical protein